VRQKQCAWTGSKNMSEKSKMPWFMLLHFFKCRICGFTWEAKCWEEYTGQPDAWSEVVNSYR